MGLPVYIGFKTNNSPPNSKKLSRNQPFAGDLSSVIIELFYSVILRYK